MITGYVIFGLLLMVFITSYFRNKIVYEAFYILHHLVFALFLVTAAHTLDEEHRHGKNRSQAFKWFTASLLYYICDRLSMFMNHRYTTSAVSVSGIEGKFNDRSVVVLRIKRPPCFQFCPGQCKLYLLQMF